MQCLYSKDMEMVHNRCAYTFFDILFCKKFAHLFCKNVWLVLQRERSFLCLFTHTY